MNLKPISHLLSQAYQEDEYPALAEQIERYSRTQPLKGLRVLDATPVFRNTLLKHLTLISAGAELTVGLSQVMAYDPHITTLLAECGIPVVHADDTPQPQDLILDCAGSFSTWPARLGISELTRSGVEAYHESLLPVFLADGGRIKRIETCLGTGESYFRAMAQLGYTDWKDRPLVVFGSGKVGTGIIYYAHRLGAEVRVVTDLGTLTPRLRSMISTAVQYDDTKGITSLLQDACAIVTATGIRNAVTTHCPAVEVLHSHTLMANMGVEDEFGPDIPASAVLMEKRTLNFILEEPTHLKYIDATMALHNEGACHLLTLSGGESGLILPPDEMEEHILDITRQKGCISSELEWIE